MHEQARIDAEPEQISAPESVSDVLKLFEPAPEQIPGQTSIESEKAMSTVTYERVDAGDIQVGDRVARARTHRFREVAAIKDGPTSVRIFYTDHTHDNDRPRKSARWWREVPGEA